MRKCKRAEEQNTSVHSDEELNVREATNQDLNPQDSKSDTNIEHIGSEILVRQKELG